MLMMERRSNSLLYEVNEIKFYKCETLDLSKVQQLPTYRYVIERYLTLCGEKASNLKDKKLVVITELVNELRLIWVYMNIPPSPRKVVRDKVTNYLDEFERVKRCSKVKRENKTFKDRLSDITFVLENGFDIKATSQIVIDKYIEQYGIIYGDEERLLYEDNCVPVIKGSPCTRLRFCGGVDTTWLKAAKIRHEKWRMKQSRQLKKQENILKDQDALKQLKDKSDVPSTSYVDDAAEDNDVEECEKIDQDYMPSHFPTVTSPKIPTINLKRRSVSSHNDPRSDFPQIPIRTGYKTFNIDVVEALVMIQSKFKVDGRKAPHLLAYIANKIFKQEWVVSEDTDDEDAFKTRNDEEVDCDTRIERHVDFDVINDVEVNPENSNDDEAMVAPDPPKKKKRRYRKNLDNVLPSRPATALMVENAALLSFADMAEVIHSSRENDKVVTYGSDDTVKAAGEKKHDIKTSHVSVIDKEKKRETFTSGFYHNVSHSGVSAAKTVQHDIAKMAVITNSEYEDMMSYIDFFMNDRAGDGNTMLDELNVEESRRLKCNAHILLAVDVAVDKVFKDVESQIGMSNLISSQATHCFNGPKNSVWYLGLIAISKLLSPSHLQESISLQTTYIQFLKIESEKKENMEMATLCSELLKRNFKGFICNRFGRIGELSQLVLEHWHAIEHFFNVIVDEHANKLVLAVSCYQKSSWFRICIEVASYFNEVVIRPMKQAIGIDQFKDKKSKYRSWDGIKLFFEQLLLRLEGMSVPEDQSGKGILQARCAAQIKEAIERQISMSSFFNGTDESEDIKEKRKYTPLTNLGCESEFASVGNDFKHVGGGTRLKTVSDKHVVARNKLFEKDRWTNLNEEEKRAKWKWASNSPQAKKVKSMEKTFIDQISSVEKLALGEKREQKKKSHQKLMKNLEECRRHGGPLTMENIQNIQNMSYEQVKLEAGFLKKTTAPNIRYKRKIGKKFIAFTLDELKQQVIDAIKPNSTARHCIDDLIIDVLQKESSLSVEIPPTHDVGTIAWWDGPLEERYVGIVVALSTLQLFERLRNGYLPYDIPRDCSEWTLVKKIERYHYNAKGNKIYLIVDD